MKMREKRSTLTQRLLWVRARANVVCNLDAHSLFRLMRANGLFAPTSYFGDCSKAVAFLLREVKRKSNPNLS